MKKILLIAIILSLVLPIVYAADEYKNVVETPAFDIKYNVVDDTVSVFEEAEFEMVVVNKLETTQRFRIKEFSDTWELRTSPISVRLSGLVLEGGEQSDPFSVFMDPREDLKLGQYELLIYGKFESQDAYQTFPMTFYIGRLDSEALQYLPSINVNAIIPKDIDPRQEVVFDLSLDNLNRLDITDLVISVTSEDDIFVGEEHTTLKPLETGKKYQIRKTLDPLLEPQEEDITLTFRVGERIAKTVHQEVTIKDYTSALTLNKGEDKRFLKTVQTLVYTNEGNAPKTETVIVEMSSLKNLVTRVKPKAKVITNTDGKTDGKRYLAWDLVVGPQESSEVITVITSYRLLWFLVLVGLLYLAYWYITKSPINVRKSAEDVHAKSDGITALKVKVIVKNPTKNTIKHVKVIDKVPGLADVVHEFDVGTLKPSKILKHEREGTTLVKWELETLEPFEERILIYKIKPQLSIVGGLTLPPVVVRYRCKRQEMVVRSAKLVVRG